MFLAAKAVMSAPESSNVLSPEGALDFHIAAELNASLEALIDQKPKRLVVDLSRVDYVDSSGLAVLIQAMQSLEDAGGLLMLAGAPQPVCMILECARLDGYFLQFPNVEAALAAP
jgi:anti-sigma B factor antagonist